MKLFLVVGLLHLCFASFAQDGEFVPATGLHQDFPVRHKEYEPFMRSKVFFETGHSHETRATRKKVNELNEAKRTSFLQLQKKVVDSGNGRLVDCSLCSGSGAKACTFCKGMGFNECQVCHGAKDKPCKRCDGAGLVADQTCTSCNGSGIGICKACGGKQFACSHCEGVGFDNCAKCEGTGREFEAGVVPIQSGRDSLGNKPD